MSYLCWWLQSQTRFPRVGLSLGWTGVWTVATSCGDLAKPSGTPSVFSCGPELAGPCVCGTPADKVLTVGTMPCCSGFLSPVAWFTGWTAPADGFVSTAAWFTVCTAPADGFVSTVGRYTPSWPNLAAIWTGEERKNNCQGVGTIGSSTGSLSSLSRLFEQAERQIKILALLPRVPLS